MKASGSSNSSRQLRAFTETVKPFPNDVFDQEKNIPGNGARTSPSPSSPHSKSMFSARSQSMNHHFRLACIAVFLAGFAGSTLQSQEVLEKAGTSAKSNKSVAIQTVAEKSNYLGTAREAEVLDFLNMLDASSDFASQVSIGKTTEGRPIQALIVAKEEKPILPLPASDERLVIVLLGGIHSGECDSKEAVMALARDLLSESQPKYLDKAVLIFIPNFNADGNERVGVLHRPGQEGPALGMGTRENAVGLDLNRDFVKLDTSEVRSLVRAIDSWDVDVLMDAHTTNGSLHQYDLTYDVPHNPAANQQIVKWLRNVMIPDITMDLANQGLPTFYYGNFSRDHKRWESFGHEPRYSTEYMGLRGKIGILVESYSYASYQRRIDASYMFIQACLDKLTEKPGYLKELMRRPAGTLPDATPIQAKIVAEPQPTIAKGYSWNASTKSSSKADGATSLVDNDHKETVPVTGPESPFPTPKDRKRKSEMIPTDFEVQLLNIGESTLHVESPEFYFLPVEAAWAAGRLRMHGIEMSWVEPNSLEGHVPDGSAIQYRIDAIQDLPEFQNHKLRKLEVSKENAVVPTLGGWLVSARQPLGKLATYLLEPQADDALAVWNFFDPSLTVNAIYPVIRLEKPLQGKLSTQPVKPLGLSGLVSSDVPLEPLTLDKIYHPQKKIALTSPPAMMPKWLPNDDAYLISLDGRWQSVDCRTGAMQPFDRPKRLADALAKLEAFDGAQANAYLKRINVFDAAFERALIEHQGDLFVFQTGSSPVGNVLAGNQESDAPRDVVRQITHTPSEAKELAELSPSGKHVAYIHENNIWIADCETTEVKKLTQDGAAEILNGKLDWVYQEEIYGRGQFKGYWWSPDGNSIAYLRLDETLVPRFQIDNSLSFAQKLEETRYPKSGQPNPGVTLHVVQIATGKSTEVPLDTYSADDRLIVRVGWNPLPGKSAVVFQMQNRIQSMLDVCSYDLATQKVSKIAFEVSPAWVDVIGEPRWLPDGSFLWLSDSAGGRRHLFQIAPDGTRSTVTEGAWDVKSIEAVSPDGKQVWLLAHRSSPVNTDLLRVDLATLKMETVGEPNGVHRVSVHPKCDFYFDSWSDSNTPNQLWLRDQSGANLRYVGGYRNDRFEYLQAGKVEMFEIEARDGLALQSLIYKPTDFENRIKSKKLPVLIHVYGGPAARTVENSWTHRNDIWHRYLAEQGICVLFCDNRSALGRGNSDTWKIYKDLGSTELRDLEDAVHWLEKQGWADMDRIGLWGWSYGGYFTAYSMTHSNLFRAGIAGAPVTDWSNYDSVYTERYMDTPQSNPEGYKTSSVVESAKNLNGRLMLIHGEIDDNVHMANTLQLVNALQNANKQFDLMIYPNNRHGVNDPEQVYHQYQMMTDFFRRYLLEDR